MQITVATDDDKVVTLEVDGGDPIENLRAILEAETGVQIDQQQLVLNNNVIPSSGTVSSAGIQDGDLLVLHRLQAQQAADANSPLAMMQQIRNDAHTMMNLERSNPAMYEAVRNNNIQAFVEQMRVLQEARQQAELARQREIDNSDEMDPEVQARLAEEINQKNVEENFAHAMEHTPEVFGTVVMLYVDMEVNGVHRKAFVDSGAQSTIMSQKVAEECGILRLVDRRFKGVAMGVGTGVIIGRVHQAPLRVGGVYLPCSITVLESDKMPFLFGLDMLRRYQCCIDLQKNVLHFGSCNVSLPFLGEHEIPKGELHDVMEEEPKLAEQAQAGSGPSASAPASAAAAAAAAAEARASASVPPPQPRALAVPASQPAAQPGGGVDAVLEAKVARLMGLGFGREQSLSALRLADGNEDAAAGLLFDSPGGF